MGENGLSVADALALQNKNGTTNGDGFLNGGQGAWWVIILILFFAFAGWGNRGGNNNGNNDGGVNTVFVPTGGGLFGGNSGYNSCCTPATQQSLTDAFNFNQLDNGIRGVQNGLCDGFYSTSLGISNLGNAISQTANANAIANLQGFNGVQNTINQTGNAIQSDINAGVNGIQNSLCSGFNGVQSAIAQTNYNMKDCCCETRESIMNSNFANQTGFNSIQNQLASCCCDLGRGQENLKYALAQSTCDIMTNADKNTDRIINYLTQNELDSLRNELQSAQLQLSQLSQTSTIVNRLNPAPVPAYTVSAPFSTNAYPNNAGCGCY
jgi:hypothetical protein